MVEAKDFRERGVKGGQETEKTIQSHSEVRPLAPAICPPSTRWSYRRILFPKRSDVGVQENDAGQSSIASYTVHISKWLV
jgi:hypothetical protein